MKSKISSQPGRIIPILVLTNIALLFLTSCSNIRLVSDYDDITDKKVTELQDKFARHFVKLERAIGTSEADYSHFIEFYDAAKSELRTLRVRANAIDKNTIVTEQLDLLEKNVSDLEELHKMGFSTTAEIIPLKSAFELSFTAIIKFQMGLKRGKG
ncbi:MAG: hypothetical protein JXB34_09285 [Bacteroidales bacterium]|nr:hypothetical protein [Bacteroidales bacterium]